MIQAPVYNDKGQKVSDYNLDEALFGLDWNADLVHQVVTILSENARLAVAHTKGRGEVAGGGKKPWRQKGTGRARHGSIRSPIWKGGGVTHGPTKDKRYGHKLNKKMKAKALFTVLSRKQHDGELLLLNELNFSAPKTKQAADILSRLAKAAQAKTLAYKSGKRALVAVPALSPAVAKSFRNLGGAQAVAVGDLNPLNLLTYKYLVLVDPAQALAKLSARLQAASAKKRTAKQK